MIGWAGHEVQWQHDPGSRSADVQTLYTTADVAAARALIDRYGIRYVVSARSSRRPTATPAWRSGTSSAERVYEATGTTIWQLR